MYTRNDKNNIKTDKMLMVCSTASMVDQFNMNNIRLLQDMGCRVDVACNFNSGNTCSNDRILHFKEELDNLNIKYYQIGFERNITKVFSNIRAIISLTKVAKNENYDFIHCHTPIGGLAGRIAGKLTKTKVIYTAHGFHFYKGAPKKIGYYTFQLNGFVHFGRMFLLQ